jgi:5-methylcytosine-specific restriction endonuclease McrA
MRWFIWKLKGWIWWRWYNSYLKSDDWAAKRKSILKRDNYQCQACGSRRNLQVHHKSYKHVGHELNEELTVLCRPCHMKKHGRKEATGVLSGKAAAVFFFILLGLLIVISILA